MSAVTRMTEDEEDAFIEKALEIARSKIKRQHDELEGYSDIKAFLHKQHGVVVTLHYFTFKRVVEYAATKEKIETKVCPRTLTVLFPNDLLERVNEKVQRTLYDPRSPEEIMYSDVPSHTFNSTKKPNGKPEMEMEDVLFDWLTKQGHKVERQVRCGGGIVDIVDRSDFRLIECKAASNRGAVVQAVSQLERYLPHFPGYTGVVCFPSAPNEHVIRGLEAAGVEFIILEEALEFMGTKGTA